MFFFFSQYFIIFANKTGNKIKQYRGGSTRVRVRPIVGGYEGQGS